MKLPRAIFPALVVLALVALAMPAGAQTPTTFRSRSSATDDLIARAQEVVAGADNSQALDELSFAIRLQADAKASFGSGRFSLALDLTMRARLHADRAIALIKGLPDPDRVLAQLERTRELLDAHASTSRSATGIAPARCCARRWRCRTGPKPRRARDATSRPSSSR